MPSFPAYPSSHTIFGGMLFQMLCKFYGHYDLNFTFVADEFNGVTWVNKGNIRPYMPRKFSS